MDKTFVAKAMAGTFLLAAGIGSAYCQTQAAQYPSKPVRIIAAGPGGSVDFSARILAEGMASAFNQGVVVESRPAGVIPGVTVARAQPDGYTLLLGGGSFWVAHLLQDNVPYDVVRDFAPISLIYEVPYVLVAHHVLPIKSVKELISLAKAQPSAINYGSSNAGSGSNLSAALFAYMADVNIVRIPYKAAGARSAGLMSGEVQIEFASGGGYASQIKSGKLKALAVGSAKPWSALPGVPTIAETLPGYESTSSGGLFAPAKTPGSIIARLNQETVKVLTRPDVRDKYTTTGVDAIGSSPERLATHMKSEIERIAKLVKATGLREEE